MKDYLLKTGKYKITSVKCKISDGWFSVSESSVEVAYPIGDTETEDWLMNIGVPAIYVFDFLSISGVFTKEIKTKLLNL
jgi:hypothetical protein